MYFPFFSDLSHFLSKHRLQLETRAVSRSKFYLKNSSTITRYIQADVQQE